MTAFHFHLRLPSRLEWDKVGVPFASLEHAFLDVCETLPTMAGELLREGHDLSRCVFMIASPAGEILLEVPFTELRRPPVQPGPPHRAGVQAETWRFLDQAQKMATNARLMATDARASMIRSRAVTEELRQRRHELRGR